MWDALTKGIESSVISVMALCAFGGLIILVTFLRKRVATYLEKHFIVDEIKHSQKIMDILVEMRVKTRADRVSICLFHNGERYTNGSSILKISAAYETVADGISSERAREQNVLVSTVPEAVAFLTHLDHMDKVHCDVMEQMPNCYYKSSLLNQGLHAVAKYPLRDGEDIIGFICVDFVKSVPEMSRIPIIMREAPRLEMYLNRQEPRGFWRKIKGR